MISKSCISTGKLALILTLVGQWMLLASGNVVPPDLRGTSEAPLIGLYEENGKVALLTVNNFNDTVLRQNRGILVEFYNTYCARCQQYAPHYKALAERLYPWRETLLVAAIDCKALKNTGVCRDYEISKYPNLHYFSPGYVYEEGKYGQSITASTDLDEAASNMAQILAAETGTTNLPNFPNFQSVSMDNVKKTLFCGLDSNKKYVILTYEPDNTTVGLESILQFHLWPDVQVRRVTDLNVAKKFQIDGVRYKIATVDRQGKVVPYSVNKYTALEYFAKIQCFLKSQNFKPRSCEEKKTTKSTTLQASAHNDNSAIILEVLRKKHLVYQADLEMAIRQMLFNEIPKVNKIHGEQLSALQNMLQVLQNYHPLGAKGDEVFRHLNKFVLNAKDKLSGANIQNELETLNKKHGSIFSSNNFVGCVASQQNKRGYTCSLWTLFHYLTIKAERLDICREPLQVLRAIHGYVKFFFGCEECSNHFQEMAERRKIWHVSSKAEAALWLWEAHNEVNNRTAGDATEDPKFPKIQFPSESSCSQCHKAASWDKDAVLNFLKNMYNPDYVSRYGTDTDNKSGTILRITSRNI